MARLALASGRRISRKIATSRRVDLDVGCFSDEKIFRVDAVASGHGFYTISWANRADVTVRPSFSGYTMRKNGRSHCDASPNFEPFFVTHPSQVGSTSPFHTPRSDVAGHVVPTVSASRDSTRFKAHRLCHLVLSQQIPTDVSSHFMADSRDKLHLTRHHPIHTKHFAITSHSTAQGTMFMLRINV